jgi:hypothetical protein
MVIFQMMVFNLVKFVKIVNIMILNARTTVMQFVKVHTELFLFHLFNFDTILHISGSKQINSHAYCLHETLLPKPKGLMDAAFKKQ